MLVVTFVRHAESKSNAAHLMESYTPGELTERGISMAEHLGRHLAEETFTRIYTSDLKRCHDTTLNILKESKHHSNEMDEMIMLETLLREMNLGDMELQPTSSYIKLCVETGVRFPQVEIHGGESFADTKKRAGKFFEMLCNNCDAVDEGGNVLAVTHGAWLICFLHYLVDNKEESFDLNGFDEKLLDLQPHNTATTKVIIHKRMMDDDATTMGKRRRVKIIHLHDTQHLPDHLQKNVLLRKYAETKANVASLLESLSHGELTERGISMAAHLGRHLAEEKFTRVYSSDLKRCHDTALNILKHSNHLSSNEMEESIVLAELLRERSMGDFEMQPCTAIMKLCAETGQRFPSLEIPGGESFANTKKRTAKFFEKMCNECDDVADGGNVLVVTHGGWLICFLYYLIDNKEIFELHGLDEKLLGSHIHNTATTKVIIHKRVVINDANGLGKRKVEIKLLYDTQHLPSHLQKK